jgi:hypothetical protein
MMGNNIFLLTSSHSKKSTLDKAYFQHIKNLIQTLSEEDEARWEIYSIIIEQLINEGKEQYYTEIKYRISDGENPNEVMLDIIEREADTVDNVMWFFKRRIEEYLEEDYFKKFLS